MAVLTLKQQRQKRRRASAGRVLVLKFITILRGIEATHYLTAVSWRRRGCSIVAKVMRWRTIEG
jgi:hypothetical protein